ncbi:hypothetical protein MLD38_014632 [Melastoma candidum]|uniref:Uncharacterized protein n=1 Tax=Melastoma candidum TaxID=119954 RepID=A0ACB9RDH2_9MYRT|nr:hypothetical protein MLD38_014632 [Melastoma candidum]
MQQLLFQRQQQQQQQQPPRQQQPQLQQQQPQQLQSQQQQPSVQQRRDGSHLSNGNADGIGGSDPLVRQNPGAANAMVTKMYAERLKGPPQRDSLDEKPTKCFGENVGQILDPNHASILKSAAGGGQPSGQVLHVTTGGISPKVQHQNQQLSGAAQDIKPEISPLNPRGPSERSLMGMAGWPLTGWENIRGGLLQPQKSFMQSPQAFSIPDVASASTATSVGTAKLDVTICHWVCVPNVSSSLGGGLLQRGDTDMMIKLKIAEMHQQQQQLQQQFQQNNNSQLLQQQQLPQHSPQIHNHKTLVRNCWRDSRPLGPKEPVREKKKATGFVFWSSKQLGYCKYWSLSSSTPSTPSTHAPGDVMSMPPLPHTGASSKPLMMFGSDGSETLPSPNFGMWMVIFGDNWVVKILWLFHDQRDAVARCMDAVKASETFLQEHYKQSPFHFEKLLKSNISLPPH